MGPTHAKVSETRLVENRGQIKYGLVKYLNLLL